MSEQKVEETSASPVISRIDARLADLREANETYRKASWDWSDAIQRNDREIRWLLDTKSEIVLERRAADVIERVAAHNSSDPATDDLTVPLAIQLAETEQKLRGALSQVEGARRAIKAANVYYGCYVQDEAEDVECCISPEQHEAAKELRDALREATPSFQSTDDATANKGGS